MWVTRLDLDSSSKCQLKTQLDDQFSFMKKWCIDAASDVQRKMFHALQ